MEYSIKYLIDFMILFLLYIFIFYKKWNSKGKDKLFINTLIYVYFSFVLYFTLMPTIYSIPNIFNHSYSLMNMIPFIDVISGRGDYFKQIVLNIIMTMPFGFLFPLTESGDKKFYKTILVCFIMSLTIELLQPLLSGTRTADITDLITNTIGGVIGYVFYIIFRPLTYRILDRINKL